MEQQLSLLLFMQHLGAEYTKVKHHIEMTIMNNEYLSVQYSDPRVSGDIYFGGNCIMTFAVSVNMPNHHTAAGQGKLDFTNCTFWSRMYSQNLESNALNDECERVSRTISFSKTQNILHTLYLKVYFTLGKFSLEND